MQTPDEVTRQLRRLHQELKSQTPYQIFDLWEGCGRELVQQTFYRLVKEHHPDSYGGNLSDEVKRLAQDNFLMVKDAYSKLRMAEGEQTVPDRPSASKLPLGPAPGIGLDRELSKPISMPGRSSGMERSPQTITIPPSTPLVAPTYEPQRPSSSALPIPPQPTTQPLRASTHTTQPSQRPQQQPQRTHQPSPALAQSSAEEDERAQALARLRAASRRPLQAYGLDPQMSDAFEERISTASVAQPAAPHTTPEPAPSAQDRRALLEQLASKRPTPPPVQPNPTTAQPNRQHMATPAPAMRAPQSPADEAKESFNQGYQEFKLKRINKALPLFKRAWELENDNGLYLTFYGQCLFLEHPDKRDEAEKLLRQAVLTKHRQALPDAHLFLGLLLKTKPNGMEEAIRHFRNAYYLNPTSHEAEREIRLWERRHSEGSETSEASGLLKKLFKK